MPQKIYAVEDLDYKTITCYLHQRKKIGTILFRPFGAQQESNEGL